MARSVAVIDLRRLWEPERPAAPASRRQSKSQRRACRREKKATLRELRPRKVSADLVTVRWLAAKCSQCMACPKMVARLSTTPQT